MRIIYLLLIGALANILTASNSYTEAGKPIPTEAQRVIWDDKADRSAAIRLFRESGREGLESLFTAYRSDIEAFKSNGERTERWQRISHALDSVAMQKDAYASEFYWHTNLQEAKKQAKLENKPILSLRLLGNLNEEFSCANSRFFRSLLYSNAEISKFLRANYILHWKSVRPAPKVTIDFGDGRKIERTLTGNSIHCVLKSDGTVVDALPGLNSPKVFMEFIVSAGKVATDKIAANQKSYRSFRYQAITSLINSSARQSAIKFDQTKPTSRNFTAMPTALAAAPLATSKMIIETDILNDITPDIAKYGNQQLNLEQWKKLAAFSSNKAKFDETSVAFIRRQVATNGLSDAEFANLVSNLEEYVSIDTTRNQFLFRPTLYVWLNTGMDNDVEKFNARVYSELFLTPNEDKWLGLYSTDLYTALDGNGIIELNGKIIWQAEILRCSQNFPEAADLREAMHVHRTRILNSARRCSPEKDFVR